MAGEQHTLVYLVHTGRTEELIRQYYEYAGIMNAIVAKESAIRRYYQQDNKHTNKIILLKVFQK